MEGAEQRQQPEPRDRRIGEHLHDGVGQLFGLWASTWQSRLVTGTMFALALVWFAYPYLEQGMAEMHQDAVRNLTERGVS